MNFWAQSMASPFRVTPRYDAQKSQTPVSGSVVYNKMRGSFKIGKEREEEKKKAALTKGREKTLWTRNERWIIQGHQQAQCDLVYRLLQKSASLEDFVSVYRTNHIKREKREETRIRQSPVDFRPVEDWNETVAIGDVIEFIVDTRRAIMLLF